MVEYNFCPQCGTKLVHFQHEGKDRTRCPKCDFVNYGNSRPTSSAIVVNEKNETLLGKRAHEPHKGEWDSPGGFLDLGEHPEDGLHRETVEEINAEVDILEMLPITMDVNEKFGPTLNIYYLVKIKPGQQPKPSEELYELKWFPADELPDVVSFKNCRDALNTWLEKIGKPKKYSN